MSRVGKHIVCIPDGVSVSCINHVLKIVKGTISETYRVPSCLSVSISEKGVLFSPTNNERTTRALWGTTQRNVGNLVLGLLEGFHTTLKLFGVGYKAILKSKQLILQLGYSHEIIYDIPDSINIVCKDPTTIVINGASKKQVGDVAAMLRNYRKPEPYKGKGVVRVDEFVYRKEGKKK